jgi:hypothetical protein
VQGDHHPEGDGDEHDGDAGDLGDEPALAQVLLPPHPDLGDVADAVEGDGEEVPGLADDELRLGDERVRH